MFDWFKRKKKARGISYIRLDRSGLPIPRVPIQVRSIGEKQWTGKVDAILDTGADITCLPESLLGDLIRNNPRYDYTTLEWPNGFTTKLKAYWVHLKFDEFDVPNFKVVALNTDIAIIGRDILNRHKMTLNGPNEICLIETGH